MLATAILIYSVQFSLTPHIHLIILIYTPDIVLSLRFHENQLRGFRDPGMVKMAIYGDLYNSLHCRTSHDAYLVRDLLLLFYLLNQRIGSCQVLSWHCRYCSDLLLPLSGEDGTEHCPSPSQISALAKCTDLQDNDSVCTMLYVFHCKGYARHVLRKPDPWGISLLKLLLK